MISEKRWFNSSQANTCVVRNINSMSNQVLFFFIFDSQLKYKHFSLLIYQQY
jgi:hypothetical protein